MALPPKDWPRVNDVFEGARALPADRRAAYLAERCRGDQALRQEVESLLAWDARAESVFEKPPLVRVDDAIVTKNLEGQRIGPYQLASKIFFLAGNTVMAAGVTANGSRFDVGTVQRLFEVPMVEGYWPYDVSPDGQHFLVNALEGEWRR